MKRRLLTAAAAGLLLCAGAASADCAAEIRHLTEGISKDGSLAPLQTPADATPQTGDTTASDAPAEAEGEVAKTGDAAPLATDPAQAMSGEDAQAQSAGGATAAEQAAGAPGDAKADALARAEAALAAGDEAGCMAAVEEAKG